MESAPNLKKADRVPIRRRLQDFGRTVVRSGYDMEFYMAVREKSWTVGLKYLLKLLLAMTAIMIMFVGPAAYSGLGQLGGYLDAKLPDGSSVTLSGGQLSAVLPMPFELGAEGESFVVDTSVIGLDMPRERIGSDGVLIGRDAIFFRSDDVEERTYALKGFPNFSVSKSRIVIWLESYRIPAAVCFAVVFGIFYYLAVVFGNLFFVAFGAMLSYLFSRIARVKLDYGQWFASGLYAVTFPLFLGVTFDAIGWTKVPVFPVVFFMIMASILADERARVASSGPVAGSSDSHS